MKGYCVAFFFVSLIHYTIQEPERRFACWGSFGPPVISAQCPRGTVIQVLQAGLKVKQGTGQCVFKDSDCGCEYGQPGCNMANVREQCMGRPACRLDVTQQYINTPSCRGFSDYMYIDFNCVSMERTSVHDICVTDVTVSETGFIRSPNYPHAYPNNRYCLCNLRTLQDNTIKVSILDLNRQEKSCSHSKLMLQHEDNEKLLCGPRDDDMREYDTGRSAITVVMETDDVETSGGFWLKYEASPQATVQMECFGQFKKDKKELASDIKPETIVIDARNVIGRSDPLDINLPVDMDNKNIPLSDMTQEEAIQMENKVMMEMNEVDPYSSIDASAPDRIVMTEEVTDDSLNVDITPKENDKLTNFDENRDNLQTDGAKITPHLIRSDSETPEKQNEKDDDSEGQDVDRGQSNSLQSDQNKRRRTPPRLGARPPMPRLEQGESTPDRGIGSMERQGADDISDEELDSMIQTILEQIEQPEGTGQMLPPGQDNEDLEVNIARLMANAIEADGNAIQSAEIAPPRETVNRISTVTELIPLEYDNIEELKARKRLEKPDYEFANDITDDDFPRRMDNHERQSMLLVTISPPTERVTRRDLRHQNNERIQIKHSEPDNYDRPQNNVQSREAENGGQPWWHQFTIISDEGNEEQPDRNRNRNPPIREFRGDGGNEEQPDRNRNRNPSNREFRGNMRPAGQRPLQPGYDDSPEGQRMDRPRSRQSNYRPQPNMGIGQPNPVTNSRRENQFYTRKPQSEFDRPPIQPPQDGRHSPVEPMIMDRTNRPILSPHDMHVQNPDSRHSNLPNPPDHYENYPQSLFPPQPPLDYGANHPKGKFPPHNKQPPANPFHRKFPIPGSRDNMRISPPNNTRSNYNSGRYPKLKPHNVRNNMHSAAKHGNEFDTYNNNPINSLHDPLLKRIGGSKLPNQYTSPTHNGTKSGEKYINNPRFDGDSHPRVRLKPIARLNLNRTDKLSGMHGSRSENDVNKMIDEYRSRVGDGGKGGMSGGVLGRAQKGVDNGVVTQSMSQDTRQTELAANRMTSSTEEKTVDTATGKSAQEDDHTESDVIDPDDSVMMTLIAAGVVGCILLVIVVGILIRFAMNRSNPRRSLRQRHQQENILRKNPYLQRNVSRGKNMS